jgi:membrane associated rhomboid family serine protease
LRAHLVCPDCKQPLIQIPLHSRLSHVCPGGHGKAFPTATVRKWVKKDQLHPFDLCLNQGRSGKRSCVRCKSSMKVIALRKGFEIDHCGGCELLWFDKNEFESIPQKSAHEIEREAVGFEFTVESGFLLQHSPWDDPDLEQKKFPWITVLIILSCTALTHLARAQDLKFFLFDSEQPLRYLGAPFLLSIFTHLNIGHLANNMIFLFTHGSVLEEATGEINFLKIFFLCGISGALLQGILMPGSVSLGASGAIAGVFTFLAITRPELRKQSVKQYWMIPFSVTTFTSFTTKIPIGIALLLWFLPQVVGAFFQMRDGTSIGFLAHLGGALMGAFLTTSKEFQIMSITKRKNA